ncbi:MAG: hypothetical protein OXH75_00395 [Acidobacteria bacterium]|nr:hypothetical protein [Acidobacteriota bacterium]
MSLDDETRGATRNGAISQPPQAVPSDRERRASEPTEPAAPPRRLAAFEVPAGAPIISSAPVRAALDRDGIV